MIAFSLFLSLEPALQPGEKAGGAAHSDKYSVVIKCYTVMVCALGAMGELTVCGRE